MHPLVNFCHMLIVVMYTLLFSRHTEDMIVTPFAQVSHVTFYVFREREKEREIERLKWI